MKMQHWDTVWVCRAKSRAWLAARPWLLVGHVSQPLAGSQGCQQHQELMLGWPKVTLCVCPRVSALEHTVSGEQRAGTCGVSQDWTQFKALINKLCSPGSSARLIAQKTQDQCKDTHYMWFFTVLLPVPRAIHSQHRIEAKHLGGHGQHS